MSAKEFYLKYLKPNYDEWVLSLLDERLAMNTILSANQMVDWYFYDLKIGNSVGQGFSGPKVLREHIVANVCADFQIIWDVADSHKHFERHRGDALIKFAEQTKLGAMGFGQGGFGEGPYGGGPQLLAENSGKKRNISAATKNVVAMWRDLLQLQSTQQLNFIHCLTRSIQMYTHFPTRSA